jgi:two-component system chemotaxis response regulator CheY
VHIASNGDEDIQAVTAAMDQGEPYDLTCLDIMMRGKEGQEALREIRKLERNRGISPNDGARSS